MPKMLDDLKIVLENIESLWDGETKGIAEERAAAASEALQKISDLEHLLAELKI